MDLTTLRNEIDQIDDEMLALFQRRMALSKGVAAYKKEHNLPVFQPGREKEVLDDIAAKAPETCKDGARVLFTALMDIGKCLQQDSMPQSTPLVASLEAQMASDAWQPPACPVVAVPGVEGSYSHMASHKLFMQKQVRFYVTFEDVFHAVENGEVDFGVLPIENSTAGSVSEAYSLMRTHRFYINYATKVKVSHCLAAKPGTTLANIEEVISHPQGLEQCYDFLTANGYAKRQYSNTAAAGKYVSQSPKKLAAICSEECAREYGLEILKRDIQNCSENYTRFICISKHLFPQQKADTLTVSLRLSNSEGSLSRFLTKFAVRRVNISKLESRPAQTKNFDALFYMDFDGNLSQPKTIQLLNDIAKDSLECNFLGNFYEV